MYLSDGEQLHHDSTYLMIIKWQERTLFIKFPQPHIIQVKAQRFMLAHLPPTARI